MKAQQQISLNPNHSNLAEYLDRINKLHIKLSHPEIQYFVGFVGGQTTNRYNQSSL